MKNQTYIFWRAFSWARLPLFALAIGLLTEFGRSEIVDSGAFAYRSTILVSGYAGSTTLADFPLMFKLADNSPIGFSYADCEPATLRFADADGNIVPHEIDTWNTDGTSIVWVRVPELSGTATELSMYYGGSGDGVAINAGEVWSPSGHGARRPAISKTPAKTARAFPGIGFATTFRKRTAHMLARLPA